MGRYVLRRALLMIPTFFGITLLTFAVAQLAPGDPLQLSAEAPRAGQTAALEALRHQRGLDRPLWVQYGRWVGRVLSLDFGRSLEDGRPVLEKVGEALPRTLLLTTLALFLSYLIAVPLGAWAAVRRDTFAERAVTVVLFVLYSMPSFWVAITLLLVLSGGRGWAVFPLQGLTSPGFDQLSPAAKVADLLWHVALPVAVLTYGSLAVLSRYMRGAMLETLRSDFIRTARAKGLAERSVVFRHALRNSLIPIVTLLGLTLPALVGGSVIVERIFGIPGMGELAFESILNRDYPVVMGVTTLVALFTLAATLLSDVLTAAVDPRIDLERAG
ncbi:MAG: ABC transporter permease [Myxococcaceae bacterium]|nr:ABC transporter permease [Myxococcaceae bacterium]